MLNAYFVQTAGDYASGGGLVVVAENAEQARDFAQADLNIHGKWPDAAYIEDVRLLDLSKPGVVDGDVVSE